MSIWAVVSQYGLSVLLKKQVNLRNNTLAFLPEEFIIYATTVAERRFHEQEDAFDCGDSHLLFSVPLVELRELRGGVYSADGIIQENAVSI